MKRRDFVQSSLLAAAALSVPGFRTVHATARAGNVADVAAVTGDGRAITLRGADIQDLAAKLHGQLLLAGDHGYDDARRILNPSFDKNPALIVQPLDVPDIQAAVNFARANSLLVAVKCGGHSHSGQSTCDRGMQIDLSAFRSVRVDPAARRAWATGGSLLGQIDKATAPHELATPLGTVSHTGVGGLTLGGGFGRLARKFGMAIDNLESIDIVTADGKLLHASAKDNPELFWGARGGSGNFGIVTNFEFKLHPMQRQVVAGSIAFPIARARELLTMWSEYAASAPDELYMDPTMVLPPGNAPGMCALEVCYSGPQADAERALAPIRKLGTPDARHDQGDRLRAGSEDERFHRHARHCLVPERWIHQQDAGRARSGARRRFAGRSASHDRAVLPALRRRLFACEGRSTAFAHRYALANMMTVAAWPSNEKDPSQHIEATRRYWKTLEPFTKGFYVNDLAREVTAKELNDNYRGNYQRLVALKMKHDPTNLFRLNANVTPMKAAAKA